MTSFDGYNNDVMEAWLPPEDNSEGLGAIPAGNYPARVIEVEPKTSQNTGGYYWRLVLEVADGGPYQGRKLFYNMNWLDSEGRISGGIGFTQGALKALGLQYTSQTPGQNQTVGYRKSDIVGKLVTAVVSIQQSGQYAGRNQTDRLEVYGAPVAAPGAPAPAGAFPPAAPPLGAPVAPAAPAAAAPAYAAPAAAPAPAPAYAAPAPPQYAAPPPQYAAPAPAAPAAPAYAAPTVGGPDF